LHSMLGMKSEYTVFTISESPNCTHKNIVSHRLAAWRGKEDSRICSSRIGQVNDIVYTRAGNVMQDNIPERSRISMQKIAAAEQLTVWWTFCETLMHPYHIILYLKQV
jgi:hypothetical protein